MQLTQHTDYGLRLLIVLVRRDGQPIALPQFAFEQNISYHHVAKVAQAMVRENFIRSRRGRNGGVELAISPDSLSVGTVVRALERGMQLADCANCALNRDCNASPLLAEALAAFLNLLDQTTLTKAAERRVPN